MLIEVFFLARSCSMIPYAIGHQHPLVQPEKRLAQQHRVGVDEAIWVGEWGNLPITVPSGGRGSAG